MKKSLLLVGMLAVGLANAQTGKVGINTENPNETLEVNGTLRVDNLPTHNEGKIYDGAETTETTFTGDDMMITDAQGNVGRTPFPFGKVLIGGDGNDAIPTTRFYFHNTDPNTTYSQPSNSSLLYKLREETFTLDKRSLVIVNATLTSSIMTGRYECVGEGPNGERADGEICTLRYVDIKDAEGNVIGRKSIFNSSTGEKRYGYEVKLNGKNFLFSSNPLTHISDEDLVDTKQSGHGMVTGQYATVGSKAIVLEPGTHTITFSYRFQQGSADVHNYYINVGNGSTDTLDVIAIPLEY